MASGVVLSGEQNRDGEHGEKSMSELDSKIGSNIERNRFFLSLPGPNRVKNLLFIGGLIGEPIAFIAIWTIVISQHAKGVPESVSLGRGSAEQSQISDISYVVPRSWVLGDVAVTKVPQLEYGNSH
ncbi:uncharacterized protein BDR25DRAFT_355464 [Lindgomyces ingoldianus]|uniref:Uncharacterized protein n=1 Tax=Lindgomyces ingoldianus TaxID=673940 RepID=A0ACB6QTZ9_9PLEO|nr:uncharacterized protein BDR25DRAFT_355464 [Lindgomyces ingoldianus]KAF2470351.1 hypothetical protein BDR25DRAFT_355464 [Lindgomyces ingoldianus]